MVLKSSQPGNLEKEKKKTKKTNTHNKLETGIIESKLFMFRYSDSQKKLQSVSTHTNRFQTINSDSKPAESKKKESIWSS